MTDLTSLKYCEIDKTLREAVTAFLVEHWGTTSMAVRGKLFDLKNIDGIVALNNENIIGLVTYIEYKDTLEIMSIDSIIENRGIGTHLIDLMKDKAAAKGYKRIVLITTNDNINALKFYQKRGFDMTNIYKNAVSKARLLKPSIPLVGDFGIPIKDEIEFEIML